MPTARSRPPITRGPSSSITRTHIHPAEGPIIGTSGTFTIPVTGHDFSGNTSFELILTVTDGDGLQARHQPSSIRTRSISRSTPTRSALALNFDQETNVTAPFTRDTLIGFNHTIGAPLQQTVNGTVYNFVSWSDGGAATHVITAPVTAQTYVAQYQAVATRRLRRRPVPSAFPATTILDNFNRANGAHWQ